MRLFWKIMTYIGIAILILLLSMFFLLRSSFIQNFLVDKLSYYFSKELNTDVNVGGVNINFFNIVLEDVKINDLHKNPLLKLKKLKLKFNRIGIKKKIVTIKILLMENPQINIKRYVNDSVFNYQFISDYFAINAKDASEKPSDRKWKIKVNALEIKDAKLAFIDNFKINESKSFSQIHFNPADFEIKNLNLKINDIDFQKDTLKAFIKNISFKSNNGFELKKLSCEAIISPHNILITDLKTITGKSNIEMSMLIRNINLNNITESYPDCDVLIYIKPSSIMLSDIGYFSDHLIGFENIIRISGEISGKPRSLNLKFFKLNYGSDSKLYGNFTFKGLPDIHNTYINFNIENLSISKKDIENFTTPSVNGSISSKTLKLPAALSSLVNARLTGNFSGYYHDFYTKAEIISNIGKINADLNLSINDNVSKKSTPNYSRNIIEYVGNISAKNLDIGKISANPDFGKADFKLNISGKGIKRNDVEASINGVIDTLYYKKYNYKFINIGGRIENKKFEGSLNVNDPNILLQFDGIVDFKEEKPLMNFTANINGANPHKLNILQKDSISNLNTTLSVNIEGDNIDNIGGEVKLLNTKYFIGNENFMLDNLNISIIQDNNNKKKIRLISDFADADISGNFNFSELFKSFSQLLNIYLPSFNKHSQVVYNKKLQKNKPITNGQFFEYSINLKFTEPITRIFFPQLHLNGKTQINGKYNSSNNTFIIKANSQKVKIKNNTYMDLYLDAEAEKGIIKINSGCGRFLLTDSIWLDNILLSSIIKNDTINYKLNWDNKQDKNNSKADISGNVIFSNSPKVILSFSPSTIMINDSVWNIKNNNRWIFNRDSITAENFLIIFKNQSIAINGTLSKQPNDRMSVRFSNFELSHFNYFMNQQDIDFDGKFNGIISVYNIYNTPNIISSINISNLVFNNDKLGELNINTTYDSQNKAVFSTAELVYTGEGGSIKPLSVIGYYYPESRDNNFDFNISVDNLHLKWLERYLSGFISNLHGYASGNLKLKGTIADPELTGKMKLMRTKLNIDYLNTEYLLKGDIDLNKYDINFRNIDINYNALNKPKSSFGNLNGKIYHQFFSKMKFGLNLNIQNLTCLNTNPLHNSLYYGNAVATGMMKLSGDIDNLLMNIEAKTEKGTVIYIPLSNPEELSETDFITFISKNPKIKTKTYTVNKSGLQLNFDIEATPDAEVQLVFDPRIGDVIKAHGKGNIKLEINTNGNFNMYGDYVIENGDYLFTLRKIINKHFIIDKGGKISWSGSPYDGMIDMKAIYNVRTSVDVLRPDMPPVNKRIPVECNIFLKDQLLKPTIEFSITFPEHTNDFSLEPYKTVIEPELNKQVFSLLVLRNFSTPSQFKGYEVAANANTSATKNNSTELLSNQLSNLLSQISKDFDIGVKYRPGDEITNDQVEVALATQLFNNRLLINGNVGVGGNKRQSFESASGNTHSNANIVGDVNMEYKITPEGHLKIKAFNKSNINEYLYVNSPYTQGVGIFFRKEFDAIKDFFRKMKDKK